MRVLAVADTDSYLKWSLATLAQLPAEWQVTQLVIDNPVRPSAAQMAAVGHDPAAVRDRAAVLRAVRDERPDVVLLACTGPVVSALTSASALRGPDRPVLVTGLPGISVPASRRAVELRTGCDLFLLHSHREVAEFQALPRRGADVPDFALARLPFLAALRGPVEEGGRHREVVFAAQAKVPAERGDRAAILRALAATGDGVVKVRALDGEQQTHHEAHPYPELLAELVARGEVPAGAVRLVGGSMAAALATARGLVTVSSTAALEAMAAGVGVLVLTDFGVSAQMINLVFEGSGCLGTLDDLRAGRFAHPDPGWLRDNYFHPAGDDDWLVRLSELAARRAAGALPARRRGTSGSVPARVRHRLRLVLPAPVWRRVRRARRVARRLVRAAAPG